MALPPPEDGDFTVEHPYGSGGKVYPTDTAGNFYNAEDSNGTLYHNPKLPDVPYAVLHNQAGPPLQTTTPAQVAAAHAAAARSTPTSSGGSPLAGLADLASWYQNFGVPQQYWDVITRSAGQNGLQPQVLAALLKQESGFNPGAVSPTGAQGIAQFEPGTASGVGLADPFNPNDAIPAAASFLANLVHQFNGSLELGLAAYNAGAGAVQQRGVAAEQGNYAQNILAMAGLPTGATAKTTPQGGGGGGASAIGAASAPNFNTLPSIPGMTLGQALINAEPDLQHWISQVQSMPGLDSANAQALLMNTPWWQQHSENQRDWEALSTEDPKTASVTQDRTVVAMTSLAAAMGAVIPQAQMQNLAKFGLAVAYDKNSQGIAEDQMRRLLVGYIQADKGGNYSGEAGQVQQQMKTMSAEYGVPFGAQLDNFLVRSQMNASMGDTTTDNTDINTNFRNYLKEQAKGLYPGLAKQLDQGMTTADAATPYVSELTKTLELPLDSSSTGGMSPSAAYLNDPLIQKALQYKPAATPSASSTASSQDPTVMPLWQFQQAVKQDPRWMSTNNARDSMMSAGIQVLQDMGVVASGASSQNYGASTSGG